MPGKNLHVEGGEIYTNWLSTITTDHIAETPTTLYTDLIGGASLGIMNRSV
jgi:hypothetical protein